VKAIQNLKVDKITVWDSGENGSSTAGFLKGMAGALPPLHELARQAGINLPAILGDVSEISDAREAPVAEESQAKASPAADATL